MSDEWKQGALAQLLDYCTAKKDMMAVSDLLFSIIHVAQAEGVKYAQDLLEKMRDIPDNDLDAATLNVTIEGVRQVHQAMLSELNVNETRN